MANQKSIEQTRRLYLKQLELNLPDQRLLDENNLLKPTFQTLHKLISQLDKDTGLLVGSLTPSEISKATSGRSLRIAFIQKLLDLGARIEPSLKTASASRLAAGLEPTKSHQLLQALGRLALKKSSKETAPKRPSTFTKRRHASNEQSDLDQLDLLDEKSQPGQKVVPIDQKSVGKSPQKPETEPQSVKAAIELDEKEHPIGDNLNQSWPTDAQLKSVCLDLKRLTLELTELSKLDLAWLDQRPNG